jgi:hypothetical protein
MIDRAGSIGRILMQTRSLQVPQREATRENFTLRSTKRAARRGFIIRLSRGNSRRRVLPDPLILGLAQFDRKIVVLPLIVRTIFGVSPSQQCEGKSPYYHGSNYRD